MIVAVDATDIRPISPRPLFTKHTKIYALSE